MLYMQLKEFLTLNCLILYKSRKEAQSIFEKHWYLENIFQLQDFINKVLIHSLHIEITLPKFTYKLDVLSKLFV